jgi:predicted dehydrogenase
MSHWKERVELVGIAELDETVARESAEKWEVPFWTTHYHRLLEIGSLDAVSICLPHAMHAVCAIEAARAGLHILIEKPIAATLAEADAMIKAASVAGVQLMVAENVRFNVTYQKAAEICQSGDLGDLFLIRIAREHNMRAYLNQRPWFLSDPSGGIMASGGVHDFELLRMLSGEIEHVYALTGNKVFEEMSADDNGVALAGMANGAAAVIVETFSLRTPRPGVLGSVHGSSGSLWFDEDSITVYRNDQDGQADSTHKISVPPGDTFVAEMEHFLDCIEQPETEPVTSGREERKPLAAVQAAYESIKNGKRVRLAELAPLSIPEE